MGATEVIAAFRAAERVTTICHENPDADTLGAATALRIAAERLGKEGEVVSSDVPPPFLGFMPRVDEVRRAPQLEPGLGARRGRCPLPHWRRGARLWPVARAGDAREHRPPRLE